MAQILFILIIAFILFEFVLSRFLDYLNLKTWDATLPEEAKGIYDEEKYAKAQEYERVNKRFSSITGSFGLLLILCMLFFDGFAILDEWLRVHLTEHPVWLALSFFGILYVASDILTLPFSLYGTFVIEEKFGFNKTTIKTFILDKFKGYLMTALLGGGILALLVLIFEWTGPMFWWIAWITVSGVSIFFAMFYTTLLVPIFNKLTPLEDGSLRQSIENYAKTVGFPLKKISVIDGSKRSSKGNAYFSGLGSQKSIVLFDTLIEETTEEEITAVLAHEVGHYKKKHVQKGMIISILQTGFLFFIFGWLSKNPVLAEVLGAQENSFHLALVAFGLLYSPISMIIGVLMNMNSRKNEFEADAFAKETYSAEPLKTALKKLSVNHLSNLKPHPWYVFFNYSHPPLLARIRALQD